MRLEIDTTVSAPPLADNAEVRASADLAEARSALNQGIKAAQAGDRSQARGALSRAAQLDPRNESAWLWLASISEYPEELLGFLNHVLEINPENQRAVEWKTATHSLLSKTFVQRGIDAADENKKEFATECFQTALEYDDRNAAAWMWLASLTDSTNAKITFLENALTLEPMNQSTIDALDVARHGIVKQRLAEAKVAAVAGNSTEAIRILDSLLCVSPDTIDAWMLKSHLSETFDEKIRCFESILRIDPSNVAARASRDSLLSIFESVPDPKVSEPNVSKHDDEESAAIEQPRTTVSFLPEAVTEVMEPEPYMEPAALVADSQVDSVEPVPFIEPASFIIEPVEYGSTHDLEIVPSWTTPAAPEKTEIESALETTYENEESGNIAEPFASFAEEAPESPEATALYREEQPTLAYDADELTAADYTPVYPGADAEHAWGREPGFADPKSDTVAFSYEAGSHLSIPEQNEVSSIHDTDDAPLDLWSTDPVTDTSIAMPSDELPESGAPTGSSTGLVTFVETSEAQSTAKTLDQTNEVLTVKPDAIQCPFCRQANDPQVISCHYCTAVLTLSDLELLLANQNSNKPILRQAVEEMERERYARDLDADELVNLGLGHLNLRNLQFGYDALLEASKLTPNNVVLSSQVNSLLIRLDEIKRQEEAQLKMPKGKSILVVDDSPTVRRLISGKLEKSGHEVICANDGVDAVELLQHYVPDLVLLDITMPRMDGYQVCKQIRSNPATKDVTVVMISGKDGFFDKVRGRMAGTTGYITKPFGPETLMKAVEMYLSGEAPEMETETEMDDYDLPT